MQAAAAPGAAGSPHVDGAVELVALRDPLFEGSEEKHRTGLCSSPGTFFCTHNQLQAQLHSGWQTGKA